MFHRRVAQVESNLVVADGVSSQDLRQSVAGLAPLAQELFARLVRGAGARGYHLVVGAEQECRDGGGQSGVPQESEVRPDHQQRQQEVEGEPQAAQPQPSVQRLAV